VTQAEAAKKALLSHYCELCAISEDWKRQAWSSAKDLAAQYPAEFGDLPKLLEEAMKEKTNGND
jgi:hypothetical protein